MARKIVGGCAGRIKLSVETIHILNSLTRARRDQLAFKLVGRGVALEDFPETEICQHQESLFAVVSRIPEGSLERFTADTFWNDPKIQEEVYTAWVAEVLNTPNGEEELRKILPRDIVDELTAPPPDPEVFKAELLAKLEEDQKEREVELDRYGHGRYEQFLCDVESAELKRARLLQVAVALLVISQLLKFAL